MFSRFVNKATADDLERTTWAIRLEGSLSNLAVADDYYHWRYYLCTRKGTELKSVIFDMSPRTPRDTTGRLSVTPSFELFSTARDKMWFDATPAKDVTPAMFLAAYKEADLHLFTFTDRGKGCLMHSVRVMRIMEDKGLAETGSTVALERRLETWAETNRRIEQALKERSTGTYGTSS